MRWNVLTKKCYWNFNVFVFLLANIWNRSNFKANTKLRPTYACNNDKVTSKISKNTYNYYLPTGSCQTTLVLHCLLQNSWIVPHICGPAFRGANWKNSFPGRLGFSGSIVNLKYCVIGKLSITHGFLTRHTILNPHFCIRCPLTSLNINMGSKWRHQKVTN